uniref:Transposase n=1 Tax=Globodera rostochiensis TaxID=31243 RepID=A0A914H0E5_GLORO
MSITKATNITPKLDKLNPIQLIRILLSQSLITLDKLNPIQLIRMLLSQNKTVAKKLSLSFRTIYKWKSDLGQTKQNKYPHSEQMELMKRYYEIKDKNTNRDVDIAKMLKIDASTLVRWKGQFKRQQFQPNFVDGHFVEENASGSNVHKIGNRIWEAFE